MCSALSTFIANLEVPYVKPWLKFIQQKLSYSISPPPDKVTEKLIVLRINVGVLSVVKVIRCRELLLTVYHSILFPLNTI